MNLSLKQYKMIDLTIMFILLAAAEWIITNAAGVWFPDEIYVLSPMTAMVCIVMMRWGAYAALHAFGSGLALCLASGAEPRQYAVYCIGNCFALAGLALFRIFGKERIRTSPALTLLFTAAAFTGAQLGRWLIGLMMGGTAGDIVTLFTTDLLSLVFAVVVVQLSRKLDGVYEDQIRYLKRVQEEQRRGQLSDYGDTEYGEA